ncbi:uncharacterized protein [Palaemon carinicauda]|uniref:uncharacterized protein n=1 Tax=Palaemon carinicauda TaxID=392227 RepID=UPI0035B67E26
MVVRRLLQSLPLKKQTVIKSLLLVTLLFIVYQVTFVVELSESAKPKPLREHLPKSDRRAVKEKLHPKDIGLKVNQSNNKEMGHKIQEILKKHSNSEIQKQNIVKEQNDPVGVPVKATSKNSVEADVFTCRASGKVISKDKVNDDYCDCPEDGSDEPRTNACTNSKFSCVKNAKGFPKVIPSAWVNDGICDCCDGSDEWQKKVVKTSISLELQHKVGRFLSPCPNLCP